MAKYIYYNPNPLGNKTGDCVIRALTKFLDIDWDTVFMDLFAMAFKKKDMMDKNSTWGDYLKSLGYERRFIPDTCPMCYSIADFADDHPVGKYVVATDSHVVAIVDGNYYDSWDSGDKIPMFYWEKGEALNGTAKLSATNVLSTSGTSTTAVSK